MIAFFLIFSKINMYSFFHFLSMKSLFFLLLVLLWSMSFFEIVSADTPSSADATSFTQVTNNLSIVSVIPIDDMHIRLTFSEDITPESVKIQLTKQSDHTNIRIDSLTGVTDTPNSVTASLMSPLQEGSSYSVTILAAIAKSGSMISDWALAIKDFITPIPLKKSNPPTLNAPSNPNAVVANSGNITPVQNNSITVVSQSGASVKPPVKELPPKELPLTGMNPLFLLLLILPFSYFFLKKRV